MFTPDFIFNRGVFAQTMALAALLFSTLQTLALGDASYVFDHSVEGGLILSQQSNVATILVNKDEPENVQRAARALQQDIQRVTDTLPSLLNDLDLSVAPTVLIGTVGSSAWIDELADAGKVDLSDISGKWEGSLIQLVEHPFQGIERALVIIGSDRRGTAFGVYDLCEQMGVSPWHFWLDSHVDHQDELHVAPVRKVFSPKIQYRGIFLNDEAPALSGWVRSNWDTYGHEFYEHVFDLLVRLKANFMWPAMWGNAFGDDDPKNVQLAHDFGIFMSTSHHEPMMRADREWDRYGEGPWDYSRNPERLSEFWREGAERYKNRDCVFTLGMRGQNDTPMSETENIGLLETIVQDQRQILSDVFPEKELSEIPQVWCLYKEVQSYYENGMRVPDDVTLLWSDDNWGNIRRLPTPEERERIGGAGVYYHFDYVGDPRSYRWMNVTQNAKIWEQMDLAYRYDAHKIWVVNVGDLKPMEYPIEFFLRMAFNPEDWPKERIQEFGRLFFTREFGEAYANEMLEVVDVYTRQNARRRSELLDSSIYSVVNYEEGDRVLAELHEARDLAESIFENIPEEKKDTFNQLVLHPIRSVVNVNEIAIYSAKNRMYAEQRRHSTNDYADLVEAAFVADQQLMEDFHTKIADGKWHHFMSQPHIGFAFWDSPPENNLPWMAKVRPTEGFYMGVSTAAGPYAHPDQRFKKEVPELSPFGNEEEWIDIFNIGKQPFQFTAKADSDWIKISQTEGTIGDDLRIRVSVDWNQAPKGRSTATLSISQVWDGWRWDKTAKIKIPVFNPKNTPKSGFVEANGYVSIEAEHYASKRDNEQHRWEPIATHGHTLSSMSVFPRDDVSYEDFEKAPMLEYDLYLFSTGEVDVECRFAPTLNFVPGRGLRYAIAFDDQQPVIMDVLEGKQHSDWQEAVRNGMRKVLSKHNIESTGNHRLKIWMIDPGVVLQKIVVDTGDLKDSYLGPEESYRADSSI